MLYVIAFLEGVITFISPCLLPMLPIYLSYLAGEEEENNMKKIIINSLAFILGFTIIFVTMGVFAGTIGRLLIRYQTVVNLVTGGLVIIFGLSFMEIVKLPSFGGRGSNFNASNLNVWKSILFGGVFSISWTPCAGAFLGSALMMASNQGSAFEGGLMLLAYSMGLGLPLLMSAVLFDKLMSSFEKLKKNYSIINKVAGGLLIVMGILMATGYLGRFLTALSF